jgi:hypothetical protein
MACHRKKGKYKIFLLERWSRKNIEFVSKIKHRLPKNLQGCHVLFVSNDVNTRNVPVGKMFSEK